MQARLISIAASLRWGVLVALSFVALTAPATSVAGSSSKSVTEASLTRLNDSAEQAATQGHYGEAASQFEALAAQANGAAREHALLRAARNYQLSGDYGKAQGLLALAGGSLNSTDTALSAVANAAADLNTHQAERALARLDQIPLPLPSDQASDILGLRIQALFTLNRPVLAVNTAVERARILKTESARQENQQMLWNGLQQASSNGLNLTAPPGANQITAGWLELATLLQSDRNDPFALSRAIDDWRSRYANHPGASLLSSAPRPLPMQLADNHTVALLLPLTGKQQTAGLAVRDGFMTSALLSGNSPDILVFDTNAEGVLAAYNHALAANAGMVVGPLLKEDVDLLSNSQQLVVPTLALNQTGNLDSTSTNLLYQFALDPESEAQQVATRALQDGRMRAIVLTPNNEWGQRVRNAFTGTLQAQGGTLVDMRSYDPNSNNYVDLLRQLLASRTPTRTQELEQSLGKRQVAEIRNDFDFIFVASQAAQAKQLLPALRFIMPDNSIPIYATSDSYQAETDTAPDLNDLRFADMPWVIHRDNNGELLHSSLTRLWSNNLRSRSRLYAFGIDAYRLSNWLRSSPSGLGQTLQGTTGLLALDSNGRIHRQLDWAQIVNGQPQLLAMP